MGNTARGRLEGVLQILIERTESDTSEESDVDVTDLIHEGRSPSSSPRKSASLSKLPQRKRRRLNIDKGVKHDQQTYILKLYDRSVIWLNFLRTRLSILFAGLGLKTNRTTSVLQQSNQSGYDLKESIQINLFNDMSSPSAKNEEKTVDVKEETVIKIEDKEEEIKSLPLPEHMPLDHNGELIDPRIPTDLKPLVKQTTGHFMNGDSVRSVQSLFQEHLSHWWGVR